MAYCWTPWWMQFLEYAGKMVVFLQNNFFFFYISLSIGNLLAPEWQALLLENPSTPFKLLSGLVFLMKSHT